MSEYASNPREPIGKGPSRLMQRTQRRKDAAKQEQAFRRAVIRRDGHRCRWCTRMVVETLSLVANRLEVHHVHGRIGVLRDCPDTALVLCCECHEKVTGRVNERWVIIGTAWIVVDGWQYIDAREDVQFERVA